MIVYHIPSSVSQRTLDFKWEIKGSLTNCKRLTISRQIEPISLMSTNTGALPVYPGVHGGILMSLSYWPI